MPGLVQEPQDLAQRAIGVGNQRLIAHFERPRQNRMPACCRAVARHRASRAGRGDVPREIHRLTAAGGNPIRIHQRAGDVAAIANDVEKAGVGKDVAQRRHDDHIVRSLFGPAGFSRALSEVGDQALDELAKSKLQIGTSQS